MANWGRGNVNINVNICAAMRDYTSSVRKQYPKNTALTIMVTAAKADAFRQYLRDTGKKCSPFFERIIDKQLAKHTPPSEDTTSTP